MTAPHSIIGIILARMDSKRLPGKVMAEVNGKPLIGYVIERANAIRGLQSVCLATTDRPVDDPLADYGAAKQINVYRGDTDDVVHRVLMCAAEYRADFILRLNGDSPFLDVDLITEGLSYCVDENVELVTNLLGRTFPYGVAVEVVRTEALERAYLAMTSLEDKEHLTRYFYNNANKFNLRRMTSNYPELSNARMVVDTEVDLNMFTEAVQRLGSSVSTAGYAEVSQVYRSLAAPQEAIS